MKCYSESFYKIFNFMSDIDAGKAGSLLSGLATVFLAYVAFRGLTDWKARKHADLKVKLLDQLVESIYLYAQKMKAPLWTMDSILLGLTCTQPNPRHPQEFTKYMTFVEEDKSQHGETLKQQMEDVAHNISELHLLNTKATVVSFEKIEELNDAVESLQKLHDQLISITYAICPPFMWDAPYGKQHIKESLSFDIKQFYSTVSDAKKQILDFTQKEYVSLLK